MKMITQEMYETAIHEAAHAVVASMLRHARHVDQATILPNESQGYLGEVTYLATPSEEETTWECGFAEAVSSSAGSIAQERVSGRRSQIGESDLTNIALGAAMASVASPGKLPVRHVHRVAQVLVELRWPEIEQVAAELLEHTTVYGDQVRQIVARRWPTRLSVAELDSQIWTADREALEFMTRTLSSVAKLPRKRSA